MRAMEHPSRDLLVESIGSDDLTSPLRRALGSPSAVVIDWRREVLPGGAGYIGSVHRFAGTAEDRGSRVSWSLILKVISGDAANSPPS